MHEFFNVMGKKAWFAVKVVFWIVTIDIALGATSHVIKDFFMIGWRAF